MVLVCSGTLCRKESKVSDLTESDSGDDLDRLFPERKLSRSLESGQPLGEEAVREKIHSSKDGRYADQQC